MNDLQEDIQQQLSDLDSELDLVAVERPGNESLRIFIDHPERRRPGALRTGHQAPQPPAADYSLEVSSPGPKYRRASTASETKESPQ